MNKKIFLWIISGIAAFVLLIMFLANVVVEPWIGKKIQTAVNENAGNYQVKIEKVDVSILRSGIEFKKISLQSKAKNEGQSGLSGEIESVKLKGIHLLKAVFKRDIDIGQVDVFNSRITGIVSFPEKSGPARLSPLNIRIEKLFFEQLVVDVKNTTTAQSYSLKGGNLKIYAINVEKQDTLSPEIFGQFDFDAPAFKTVSSDSLYTYSAVGINYAATSKTLTADSFAIQPNYTEYGFAAQSKFETDRVDGRFSQISFHDFSATDFVKSGSLSSSFIEIGELKLHVFRDKRKEFRHIEKPTFQEMIANYPGALNIDSIGILSGNIEYSEHAEKAIEKGSISFDEIDIKIYKITNDTIYKTEKAYLELNTNALLMGKGKIAILLKARIFDKQNTFTVNGSLSEMEASELNPILEKNAFISITSGKINAMYFSFSANDTKATGNLKLLYQGLDFAVVNKQTGETDAIITQLKSMIANIIVIESNPIPGEDVRTGIIDYERDPERFLFNYVVKSFLTGIKTSMMKTNSPGKLNK
ncbi:MAG: hypothetical protein PF694_09965 [Bacteroidetes bacterium]|jgi:hypothetical protein|nr:hypothetical protein [Bacteroidota bacterium]